MISALTHADFLDHLARESGRFRAVLADADLDAPVPGCPDWAATDLLCHLSGVQSFWAEVLRCRPEQPEHEEPPRQPDRAAMLAAFDAARADLRHELASAGAEEAAWTWSSDPAHHTVAFIARRQAHEALVHRVDAEQAAGLTPEVDARLAADGVVECLSVMYAGVPPWGSFTPGEEVVRFDCRDTDDQVWVQLGTFAGTDPRSGTTYADEDDIAVIEDPGGEPDLVVEGDAAALDLWLWHRADDADLHVTGDDAVHQRLRDVLRQPLD